MPYSRTDDGVNLYYEETGNGTPVIFVHEFAGDHRNWELQLRHFGKRFHAIAFNARGYPPSDVPHDVSSYSQDRAADDIVAVLDALGVPRAHVVGLSMGAFATLHFGIRHPERAHSLVLAGCGYGSQLDLRERFRAEVEAVAATILRDGMIAFAEAYAYGPARVQFANKDPRGFATFKERLSEHSALGSANTQLGCQKERPSIYELRDDLQALTIPTLILTGDEDWPCLLPGIFMKQSIVTSAMAVMPNCGHDINEEEPEAFNRLVGDFLDHVDSGRWPKRDSRAKFSEVSFQLSEEP